MSRFAAGLMLAGVMSLSLAACASEPLPAPRPSLDGIQAVRQSRLPPMNVGAISAAPGQPTAMNRSIHIRADSQAAPPGGYAQYLRDTLAAQLSGAGKLDTNSTLVVSGLVVDTHVDSNMPTARASLGARLTLTRDGKVVFEKTLSVESTWTSDFLGAVAIPDAFNHYTGLFPLLAQKLFTDPDFVKAAQAP